MAAPRRKYTVIGDTWLNVREEPSKDSKVIAKLNPGDTVTVEPKADAPLGWFALKDGGYVMGEFIE